MGLPHDILVRICACALADHAPVAAAAEAAEAAEALLHTLCAALPVDVVSDACRTLVSASAPDFSSLAAYFLAPLEVSWMDVYLEYVVAAAAPPGLSRARKRDAARTRLQEQPFYHAIVREAAARGTPEADLPWEALWADAARAASSIRRERERRAAGVKLSSLEELVAWGASDLYWLGTRLAQRHC